MLYDEGSTSSTPPRTQCPTKVQLVSNSKNERLLEKYFDSFEFDFEYEKSGIWSPPMRRTAYIGSQGRIITVEELMAKLKNVLEARNNGNCCTRKGATCVDASLEFLSCDYCNTCCSKACAPYSPDTCQCIDYGV